MNALVFVDALLIQPLPYANPNQLVDVDESSANYPRANLARDDYDDLKRLNTTLSSLQLQNRCNRALCEVLICALMVLSP